LMCQCFEFAKKMQISAEPVFARSVTPARKAVVRCNQSHRPLFQRGHVWKRFHKKGGKQHAVPCRAIITLKPILHKYIGGAGLANDPKAFLFQTYSRATGRLTGTPLPQANAYAMIQKRAKSADILTRVGNHTLRATGVTAYLKNRGDA
jgi:hypothetical protein